MNLERWQQMDQMLDSMLERPPAERAAFLAEACAGDESLLRQMESMLRSDAAVESFIETPAAALAAELLTKNQTESLLGQQLGHFKILAQVGAGGMGVIYRARDTRLGREVAIKVLPAGFSHDADRLRRFELEARATSALNQPNILTIYDIGLHADTPYIVTELLEGAELRAQLNNGPLPVRKALDYAVQIAAGLAAAHAKGIIHRDLKPENLFVTKDGRVKILDFGLAKLSQSDEIGQRNDGEKVRDEEMPAPYPLTNPGVVMGTAGYMSPEQVRGQEADHRSDIFSFGIILHEMLTGRRTFTGDSAVELMNAILKEEPSELSQSHAEISPQLATIVRHCLEKQPEQRFQSARDLGFALEALSAPDSSGAIRATTGQPMDTGAMTRRGGWGVPRGAWIAAGAIALLAVLALGLSWFKGGQVESRVVRFTHLLPEKNNLLESSFAVSPDGQQIAFAAADANGKILLYLRPLNSFSAQALPNTEDATLPFWSPDGRSIGFFSDEKLKRIELAGGTVQTLCYAQSSWGGRGVGQARLSSRHSRIP